MCIYHTFIHMYLFFEICVYLIDFYIYTHVFVCSIWWRENECSMEHFEANLNPYHAFLKA